MSSHEPAFSFQGFPSTTPPPLLLNVTAATASARLVLLGYTDGSVAIFDVLGNLVDHHPGRHRSSVTAVALGGGPTGDNVAASASSDCTLRASVLSAAAPTSGASMLSASPGMASRTPAPLAALAIDPRYGSPQAGDRVAHADENGRVVIFQRGWFGGAETAVAAPAGTVYAVAWAGMLLAWATARGVSIYDTRLKRTVCFVESPAVPVVAAMRAPEEEAVDEVVNEAGDVDGGESGEIVGTGEGGDAEVAGKVRSAFASPEEENVCVSLSFEASEDEKSSFYGERTQTLYVAWSKAAKVVVIGPHVDAQEVGGKKGLSPEPAVPRDVRTTCLITPSDLPGSPDTGGDASGDDASKSRSCGPFLGIASFGEHVALLARGEGQAVLLARMTRENAATSPDKSLLPASETSTMCIGLPYKNVKTAGLHGIPGGEPFLLVVVEKIEEMGASAPDVCDASAVREKTEASVASESSTGTELTASQRRTSVDLGDGDTVGISQSCVLFARALGVAERIKWLLEHGQFEDALTTAEVAPRGSLRRADVSIADVGDQFLESIRVSGDYGRLTDVLPRVIVSTSPTVALRGYEQVMQARRERWDQWIEAFKDAGKLDLVARAVPCFEPRMDDDLYNNTLFALTETNASAMLDVLKTWPADVYDVELVTGAVEAQSVTLNDVSDLSDEHVNDISTVREALFMLYGLAGRHRETLDLLLLEQSDEVFGFIKAHDLYDALRDQKGFRLMYEIDEARATKLLLDAPETVLPVETMIPIFRAAGNREWFCRYLNAIFRQDPERLSGSHDILLELLIDHAREGELYTFLRTSSHYSLDSALRLMGGRTGRRVGLFGKERVYVLATMGDLSSAMDILLVELHDVHVAIEFASEHSDVSLWDRLIDHARVDADTLAALLDSPAGGKVNPVRLIPLIASDMEIPFLRDRLHRILVDAALERALREETAAALRFDAEKLMQELDQVVTGDMVGE